MFVCVCACALIGFHGFIFVCLWVSESPAPQPPPLPPPPLLPPLKREGSLKVEKLHQGRPHTAKPLIYSGHPRPLIIIAERKTEEDMPEYGVSSEKRVHTGVSSRCVLCNNMVTCIHSTETTLNTAFVFFSAVEKTLEDRNGELCVGFYTADDIMWPVKRRKRSFFLLHGQTYLWRSWFWQGCWRSRRPGWKAAWPEVCSLSTSRPLFSWPREPNLEPAKSPQSEKPLRRMFRLCQNRECRFFFFNLSKLFLFDHCTHKGTLLSRHFSLWQVSREWGHSS